MRARLAALLLLAAACAGRADRAAHDGDSVTLRYRLKVDGSVLGASPQDSPITVMLGEHGMVPGLEAALAGRRAGERFSVAVPPKDAYGERSPAGLRRVPWERFGGRRDLAPGDAVRGLAGGRAFTARAAAVDERGVTIDLNHPLAGKTLEFSVEVLSVAAPDTR